MNILFLYSNFPAQFRHLAQALAQDLRHRVVFGTNHREGRIPGVTKAPYRPSREVNKLRTLTCALCSLLVDVGGAVHRLFNCGLLDSAGARGDRRWRQWVTGRLL